MRLQDYQDVADATDLQSLESRLVKFANEMNFGIISGALVIEQGVGRAQTFHLGNTPQAFLSTFANTSIGQRDPVMRRLKRLSAPFVYDQSMYVAEQATDLWDLQAPFGYKTGIAMALHLPSGKHFVMGVDRTEPLPGDEVALTRLMADLQLLAVHAQDSAVRLLTPSAIELESLPKLSEREREILKWTAEGKSARAVGQILSISEHNMKYHVKQVLTKLKVSSKHQAAARAKLWGFYRTGQSPWQVIAWVVAFQNSQCFNLGTEPTGFYSEFANGVHSELLLRHPQRRLVRRSKSARSPFRGAFLCRASRWYESAVRNGPSTSRTQCWPR